MYFTIRKNHDGKFWWRAVGNNNEIMGSSQLMTTKKAVKDAVETIIAEAKDARVFDKSDEPIDRN